MTYSAAPIQVGAFRVLGAPLDYQRELKVGQRKIAGQINFGTTFCTVPSMCDIHNKSPSFSKLNNHTGISTVGLIWSQ